MRERLVVIGFVALVVALGAFAGPSARAARSDQADGWTVVCTPGETSGASPCYLSFVAGDRASGNWLGIAVHHVEGVPEVQVTSGGHAYSRAEINARSDVTIVTDYCYGSYCVFVQADELVEQFREGARADVWLYNGSDRPAVEDRVSLLGFTKAYESYLERIGEQSAP
jgi:invasion protein IalB